MTPQEEGQIKIAEACGWNYDEYWGRRFWDNGKERIWDEQRLAERFDSLDAIREAVLEQDEEFQKLFALELRKKAKWLWDKEGRALHLIHQLTAADWCAAFLLVLESRKPQEATT